MLNPEQYRAVTTTEGPLLILAGAGSGKTRVLTRRVAHLLHQGVDAKNILAVTFTNKAASEMKERIAELLVDSMGEGGVEVAKRVWVSTFHSTCCRILRTDIENLGWTRRFAIYDDDDQLRLLKEIVKRRGLDDAKSGARELRGKIDFHKTRMMTPDMLVEQRRSHVASTFLGVWREYESSLKAADAVDFNDLIGLTVRLFREHPDVRAKWCGRFRYIMVDEYQDTNQQQYELLRLLAPDANSNLGVVGDDDQSIYGFRGADVSNILNFERDFANATVIKLEQNYRCSGNILDLANKVVAQNTGRFDKQLWTSAEPGPQVKLVRCSTPDDEASKVATAIGRAHDHLGYDYGDIAVIYRTNATSRVFERSLRNVGIPHRIVGGRKFYERREVRDVLGYLRLVVNPADDAALLRVINVPSRGIGPKKLEKLREEAQNRGIPLLAAARGISSGAGKTAAAIKAFVDIMDELTEVARGQPPSELVAFMLDRTGYWASLEADGTTDAKNRQANLKELIKDASDSPMPDSAVMPMDKLRAWLDRIALAGQADEVPDGGEVTLMTVHCAKGLEYPVVFVVHMMQGLFPHAKSQEDSLDEERRLAYVAFTRAKQLLVITRSRVMPAWSDASPDKVQARRAQQKEAAPSDFLYGLPEHAVAGDVPKVRAVKGEDPAQRQAQRRRSFLRTNARYNDSYEPDGDYTLIEVTELEQLATDVLVRHPVRGFGRIRRVRAVSPIPVVVVELDPETGRTDRWNGTEVEIVVQ